ncbi:MAG: Stf0 family sulfotransferase [Chloroflexota bacterium]
MNSDPRLKKIALDLGLLKSRNDYTRFIILGRSRTGSNYLRGLLNSHPAVLTLGEIFRNEDTIDFDHPDFVLTPQVLSLYQSDPEKFLDTVVFRKVPAKTQALGFKLFYYHAREGNFSRLWQTLERRTHIHILHIKRRNILRTHVSRENAQQTGKWVNTSGEKEEARSFHLDYQVCLEDFIRTRQWEQEAEQFFKYHPVYEINYEDLVENTAGHIHEIQQFLGLPPHPVQARTYKQIQKPLSEIIANYAELKHEFAGSEWAVFFEE